MRYRHREAIYDFYPPQTTKLPPYLFEVAIGTRLRDRTLYCTKTRGSNIKFEQDRVHKEYLFELFTLFKDWTLAKQPYEYIPTKTKGTHIRGKVKSYSFRTISHPAFNPIYDLFLVNGKKIYKKG